MVKHRSNLLVIRTREPTNESPRELTQSDYVIFDEWMITPEGQFALARAEQLQRQRIAASSERHESLWEHDIAG